MKARTPEEWNRWLADNSQGVNDEAWRGIMCFLRWIQIREENGHPVPAFLVGLEGDLFHSRLIRRLLDGKEPLEQPPPEKFGQGWYELVETGRGIATEVSPWQWAPESKIAIDHDIWTIARKRGETEFLVTYRAGGEVYRLSRIDEKEWLLERCEEEPREAD